MTGSNSDPDMLAREAATWFARMRGPEADAARGRFDAWLARGPDHRAAYNRAGEIFALGKLLGEDPAPVDSVPRQSWRVPLAGVMACLIAVSVWFGLQPHHVSPAFQPAAHVATTNMLVTEAGEERLARLDDGSTIRLSGDSRVAVAFGATVRTLRLLQGSARFDVAHERRPFIVLAGGGSVTARGTVFDVTLTSSNRVEVRLLRGAIDVQLPHRTRDDVAPIRRLDAGESIAYLVPPAVSGETRALSAISEPGLAEQSDVRDLDSVPVRVLLADANRETARPIRLGDTRIGDERVSGRLRVDDSARLARQLSVLFGWSIDTHDPREIVLNP